MLNPYTVVPMEKIPHSTTLKISLALAVSGLVIALGLSTTLAGEKQDDADSSDASQSTDTASSDKATELAQKVQQVYDNTEDFKAKFKQTYKDVAAGESRVNYGRVYFKKPGKMRWDYHKNEETRKRKKMIVSNGTTLWIYEYEFKQVFKKCLKKSQLPSSLTFLMGKGNLTEQFEVSVASKKNAENPILALVPKQKTGRYKKLEFKLDPETHRVVETTVFDPYGNINTFKFSDIQTNMDLPDSGFKFEAPEDARVLNPNKTCQ